MKRAAIVIALFATVLTREAMAQEERSEPASDSTAAGSDRARLSGTGSVGVDYRRLFAIPMTGISGQIGVGAEMPATSLYVTAGAFVGSTDHGLPALQLTLGLSGAIRAERFALGSDLRFSYMELTRATDGTALSAGGIGLAPFLRYDLVRFDEGAIFLEGKVNLDFYGGDSGSLVWGPALSVGLRL